MVVDWYCSIHIGSGTERETKGQVLILLYIPLFWYGGVMLYKTDSLKAIDKNILVLF